MRALECFRVVEEIGALDGFQWNGIVQELGEVGVGVCAMLLAAWAGRLTHGAELYRYWSALRRWRRREAGRSGHMHFQSSAYTKQPPLPDHDPGTRGGLCLPECGTSRMSH
jgi:hypothetical protein